MKNTKLKFSPQSIHEWGSPRRMKTILFERVILNANNTNKNELFRFSDLINS